MSPRATPGTALRGLVDHRPIVTRLVLAVAAAMTAVLLVAGAFVFWRVGYALDRQLDQDLDAYRNVVERSIATGAAPPDDTPGQRYQVYGPQGRVVAGNASTRLADRDILTQAARDPEVRADVGHLLPPTAHPYKVVVARVEAPNGTVVVASAISRSTQDEALRELLLQLGLADLATLVAASLVGYGTARAALNPVERYRLAAERADAASLLPVDADKDDEITRLGHTFNALLGRIRRASDRERQFLADASHELRSPLALMRTELEVALLRRQDDIATTTTLESLRGQVERLVTLSNALLDLEEIRACGEAPRDRVEIDLLLKELVSRFTPFGDVAGRRLEVAAPAGLSLTGDQHWLELALGNIVANALRHGQGTVRVTVGQDGEGTRFTVGDEGPGIPAGFEARAFDRFSRAESSRTTPGTGLGLALVRAVAEAHGGTAAIHGSEIVLDLPTRGPLASARVGV